MAYFNDAQEGFYLNRYMLPPLHISEKRPLGSALVLTLYSECALRAGAQQG